MEWGWVFLIIGLGASFAAIWLTDSDLEVWAKNGPFAREKEKRWTKTYQGFTPQQAFARLLGELMNPRLTIKRAKGRDGEPDDIVVTCTSPVHADNNAHFIVDTTVQRLDFMERAWIEKLRELPDGKQHPQTPYREETLETDGIATGKRYYYKGYSNLESSHIWRARARVKINHGGLDFILPPLLGKPDTADKERISSNDPGWTYVQHM